MHHVGWASRCHLVRPSSPSVKYRLVTCKHVMPCEGSHEMIFHEIARCVGKESSWDIAQCHQGHYSWRQGRVGDSHCIAISLPLNLPSASSVCLGGAGPEQTPGRRWLYLGPAAGVLSMTGQTGCPELWGRRADGMVHLSKAIKKMCWFLPFLLRSCTQYLSSDKTEIPSPGPLIPSRGRTLLQRPAGIPMGLEHEHGEGGLLAEMSGHCCPKYYLSCPCLSCPACSLCALSPAQPPCICMAPSSSLSSHHHLWCPTLAPQ